MDVRELDLNKRFDLILLPFHSFSELIAPDEQRRALTRIREHLAENGRFICTLHNPCVRLKGVDEQLHLAGTYPLPEGGKLLLWILQKRQSDEPIVNGLQLYEEYDAQGIMRAKRLLEMRFRLIERAEFEALASFVGFQVEHLYGDYSCGDFDSETSPFMIWVLK